MVVSTVEFVSCPLVSEILSCVTFYQESTIVSLLERLYDPSRGDIMFGNTNLKDMNLKAHRRKIGLVTQDPVLFSGTIKDNITYGVDPKPPMEEVINAAQVANAHTFIESFPNKYDEQVGERGTSLSGGQKQVRYIEQINSLLCAYSYDYSGCVSQADCDC